MIRAMDTMKCMFYSFLFEGGACVSLSFSLSIRFFASNLNFPFAYLFDSFIVVVFFLRRFFRFILCFFYLFVYSTLSILNHIVILIMTPTQSMNKHTHTLYSSWSLFTCRQRFSFQNIFDNFFGLAVFIFGISFVKWIFEWNYDEKSKCFGHCK